MEESIERSRSSLRREIEFYARECISTYVDECEIYAVQKIRENLARQKENFRCEFDERRDYLEALLAEGDIIVDSSLNSQLNDYSENVQRDLLCAPADNALHALTSIIDSKLSSGHGSVTSVVMAAFENVPRYDAWVPVRTSFWVGKDMELEPYMPYFGDDNEGRTKAFDLFKDMARDANQDSSISDGEVDSAGHLIEPSTETGWEKYEALAACRRRAACRHAILKVTEKFGRENSVVWSALSFALNIRDPRRLKVVTRIAEARRFEKESYENRKAIRAKRREEVKLALTVPVDGEEDSIGDGYFTESALKNFCFTCQVFACRQHEGRDVAPLIPIKDMYVENRQSALLTQKAKPCSSRCFLMPEWKQAGLSEAESREWTKEELLALHEALAIFKRDPCSLAVVVGSKTCREVFGKLEEPEEGQTMRRIIQVASQRKKIDSKLKSMRLVSVQRDENSDVEDVPIVEVEKSRPKQGKKKKKQASKRVDAKETRDENADFVPCYHYGDCTLDSCTCVKKGLSCESTCACNNIRFCIGPRGRGMARMCGSGCPERNGAGANPTQCSNRYTGCSCKTGNCNTDKCACWANSRACNPDVCDNCDCNILPTQLSSSQRRCRNIAVSIAKHKRTVVGKSAVHGYGLFAGDVFYEGDLIGIYGGQLLDTRLADMLGRLYDAKDHTFFFDITESTVIDGGVLGMKTKFCNHIQSGLPGENCMSRLVRVRGEAHIALFAKRRINPGEEFLFDYKFQSVVPEWALPDTARKEEPQPISIGEPSRSSKGRKSKR